ncbi:MAG: hypothetical protein F7C37_08135 [Desulfurococcales archaeon]|nr:hypothetical protein [Desulfurococcales archaeon]
MFSLVGYVIVFVRDMNLVLNFWKKIGINVRYSSDEWSELELDNLVLALHKDTTANPKDTGIVFQVKDIGEAVERLTEKGIEVTDPQDIGVGLEALFKDPEGNTYHIFQSGSST